MKDKGKKNSAYMQILHKCVHRSPIVELSGEHIEHELVKFSDGGTNRAGTADLLVLLTGLNFMKQRKLHKVNKKVSEGKVR